jgi:hypothetical protein
VQKSTGTVNILKFIYVSFSVHKRSYRPFFIFKNFLLQKVGTKFYIEQDPNPDPFFSKVGSGPKSSGSTTLVPVPNSAV